VLTGHRRPDAPPPPRTTSVADPLAPTTQEWREAEREKAAKRRGWVLKAALALSLPFLAGGVYAFPLVYLWRVLCVRVPVARRWGVLWAGPALACAYLFPQAVLGPTRDLLLLPVTAEPVAVAVTVPALGELAVADPFPPLRGHLTASWRTGLVGAALLCAGWGVGGFLKAVVIEPNLVLRGFITMLYAKQGTGKTEWCCGLIRNHPDIRFYWLSEQTAETLAPYLQRWGLAEGAMLEVVTRDEADALWDAHGHDTEATWEHLGPMALNQAGRLGFDVVIIDTWTGWTNDEQNKAIGRNMHPIRKATGQWHYAVLTIGHTNKEGILLGGKMFERTCDISAGMDVVEGTEVRRVTWVKDRSPVDPMKPGQTRLLMRDMDRLPPGYREPTPGELSGGGFGGYVPDQRDSNRSPTALEKVLTALGEGPSTVAELREHTGLSQPAVSGALTELEAKGGAIRIGKRGKADLWRIGGKEDGDGAADVSVQAG
jgi:hypothetical protein